MQDEQFNQLMQAVASLDRKLDAKVDVETFDKLFQHIQAFEAKVDERFDSVNERIDRLYNLVDADLKQRETDEQERLVMNHQLDRYGEWIERASSQLKIKYDRAA